MKSIGTVRKVDMLGRLVLPMKLRKKMNIKINDQIEIFVEDGDILLKKYRPQCIFCGSNEEVSSFKGRNICCKCVEEMQ